MKKILLVLAAAMMLAGCDELKLMSAQTDVVVEKGASPVVAFAAKELQAHLTKVFGAPVEIVERPRAGHVAIYLGDSAASRRAGVDISNLKRDAFVIKATKDAVYIAGKDDPKEDPEKMIARGVTLTQWYERATLFGVYEFLERIAGVRFYFPGELGTVIPTAKTLAVPQGETVIEPVFRLRRVYTAGDSATYYDGKWFDKSENGSQKKSLNWLRLRMETETIPCCHGLNQFGYLHRFAKTKPEYFALLSNGTRSNDPGQSHPGQLCLTSGIYEEVFQDALSYLKGEPASVRGVKNFNGEPGWGMNCKWGKYVDIMGQDGMMECHCPNCQAAYDRGPEAKGNWANTLVWSNTCDIARRITAAGLDGHVAQMAYWPYSKVPEMEIPPNVDVMVAKRGPWSIVNKEQLDAQNADIRAWAEKLGHPVWIWTYSGKYGQQQFPGVPQMTPKAIGDYYKMVTPWIFGTFMESESDRFLYNYLNYYILSRVCWDRDADVDAILDEHYRLMFGDAADEVKAFYTSLEQKWLNEVVGNAVETVLGPTIVAPTQKKLWGEVYSTAVIDNYRALFAKAEKKLAADSIYAKRLALIRREFLEPLAAGAGTYAAHHEQVAALTWHASAKTNEALLVEHPFAAKEDAPAPERIRTRVTMTDAPETLTILVDCDETALGEMVAAKRARDDEEMWKDNSVEVFLNPSDDGETYYHFMVNSNGDFADSKCVKPGSGYALADYKWNTTGRAVVTMRPGGWFVTLTLPKADFGAFKSRFRAEFLRTRVLKGKSPAYYNWSPFSQGIDEVENMGTITFGPERPYELDWAGRTADEFAPIAPLESAAGWKVTAKDAEARLTSATDRILFGSGTARLTFTPTGAKPEIVFAPERPIACPDGFDTVGVWIYEECQRAAYRLTAEFTDAAGAPFAVDLGKVQHNQWFDQIGVLASENKSRAAKGALFRGFRFTAETNRVENVLDFTSLRIFRDPQRPLAKTERAKRGVQLFAAQDQGHNTGAGRLPFPNRPETMTPPARTVKGLEFRLPKDDATDWSELAFRLDGGDWIPLAVKGGFSPSAGAGAKVRFRQIANSVEVRVEAPAGVSEVSFGAMKAPEKTVFQIWPYYTMAWCDKYDIPGYEKGGIYLPKTAHLKTNGRAVVVGAMFDWTQSSASAPSDREDAAGQLCCSLMYVPKTDGARNPVFERFVWTVAEKTADVFPTIPNPVSPWKHVAGQGVWRAHPASKDRREDYAYWQAVKDAGMNHLIVTDHEYMWRDQNESFTFRTHAAPLKGGDAAAKDYARFMIETLGFRYGLYNNFTDFAPVNGNWSIDRVGRRWNGQLVTAWNRCYSPRSTYAVTMCEKLAPILKDRYGYNTAYCDVHTCVTPWNRCDYDVRAPGAATFAQVYYDYGEIMLLQKNAWQGPVYSEGDFHWWYAGLADGNYAQDPTYALATRPWLVDFDLARLHEKSCNFGMGNPQMFYAGHIPNLDSGKPATEVERLHRFLAATIAYGHPGFFCTAEGRKFDPKNLDVEKKSYFLVQGIAAKYTLADVREIRYADAAGRLFATEEAVLNGAAARSQVKIVYSDGTEVAVNGNMKENFGVNVQGKRYLIQPNGWVAISGDRRAGSLNLRLNNESYQAAWSDEYDFSCRDGKISVTKGRNRVMIRPDGDPTVARQPGAETVFTVTFADAAGRLLKTGEAKVSADNCGAKKLLAETTFDLAKANPFTVRVKMNEPGFLRLRAKGPDGKFSRTETVPYAPEKIRPVTESPADFDAYWAGELARLDQIAPIDAKMELHAMPHRYAGDYDEYKLSFATFNGKRIYGFMSVPRGKKGPFPLRVTVPGAGPGANFAWDARDDAVVLLLNVVGYEQDDDSKVVGQRYKDLNAWAKKEYDASGYQAVGWTVDRETVYFHDAICGIVRAIKWAAARPEVDATRITYFGGSQGGGCGMAVVALSRGLFRRACFYITAMSDYNASSAGRSDAWPRMLGGYRGKDRETALKIAPYFDACNFARRITCPVWTSLGLEDGACEPPNVMSSFNVLGSKEKHLVMEEDTAHGIRPETLTAVFTWLAEE